MQGAHPAGHHTGRHRHGEEAIHVLKGTGFIVVDGRRYDFRPGTTIHVPFDAEHQLVNTGADEVELVSASAMDLDLFAKLGRLVQLEPKGGNEPGFVEAFPAEQGQFDEWAGGSPCTWRTRPTSRSAARRSAPQRRQQRR